MCAPAIAVTAVARARQIIIATVGGSAALSAVHALPSLHGVPSTAELLGGQAAPAPVHVSATSHTPVDARQTFVAKAKPSVGQAALDPEHVSATSHTSAEARQTVVDGARPSVGQSTLKPVHFSATSHGPAAARHTVPALAGLHAVALVVGAQT